MLASPFAFLRGSAAVMTADIAPAPVSGIFVNACGDMHVSNFGVFGSAERELIFAINDFDEVFPAPWEWDLKRLAASAAVAVRFMGGDKEQASEAAAGCVRAYREHIGTYAEMGNLEVWYDRIDERAILDALSPKARRGAQRVIDKARAKGHQRVLGKLTEKVDGTHRIVEELPLIIRETHIESGMPRQRGPGPNAAVLHRFPDLRSAPIAGALQDRGRGAQGRGSGQRRAPAAG